MPPYQRAGKWYADLRYTDSTGRRRRYRRALGSHVKSLRAARRAENEIAAELAAERHRIAMGGEPTRPQVYLSGLLDRYLEQPDRKPATVRTYESHCRLHILPLLGDVPVSTLHRRHIDQAMNHLLRQGLSPATVRSILSPLSGALNLAVTWGYLAASPMQGFKWPKVRSREDAEFIWFDRAQMRAFMDASERHSPDLWVMWLVMFRAGLRVGEAMALELGDLDLVKGTLWVRRSLDRSGEVGLPKSNKTRRVPIPPETLATLRQHRHLNGPLLCPRPDGSMWDYERVSRRWHVTRRAAGLPECGLHTTRHSYASQLVASGVPLVAVQRLLGHATGQETQRYAHLSPAQTEQWVRLLESPVQTPDETQTGHKGEVEK